MKRKRGKIHYSTQWEEFVRQSHLITADGEHMDIPLGIAIFKNNVYQVNVEDTQPLSFFGTEMVLTWLSIKRIDRHPIHDWRDLQRIKNEICGPEREALELYPAETRLVDSSNQYHLWVLPDPTRFPFGYAHRAIVDETVGAAPHARNARQRPWPKGAKPADAIGGKDAAKLGMTQKVVHRRQVG